jgi:hypothetical protein
MHTIIKLQQFFVETQDIDVPVSGERDERCGFFDLHSVWRHLDALWPGYDYIHIVWAIVAKEIRSSMNDGGNILLLFLVDAFEYRECAQSPEDLDESEST